MERRQVVQMLGSGIAALGFSSTVSARSDGEAPNGNVETADVNIFSPKNDPVEVSSGTWVNHYWGWVDADYGGDSTEDGIEAFLDAAEITVRIDGDEISDPDQYWGEPEQNDEDQWVVWWEYVTPPKGPGLYTFTLESYFPDGLKVNGEVVREPGTRNEFTGYYEVTGGSDGRSR
ncbi:hypothetical protein [Halopiger xanaduensis]|nr:hypothetical protein [Halopiger xanaduensis]